MLKTNGIILSGLMMGEDSIKMYRLELEVTWTTNL